MQMFINNSLNNHTFEQRTLSKLALIATLIHLSK